MLMWLVSWADSATQAGLQSCPALQAWSLGGGCGQPQVRPDLLDHRPLEDGRNDLGLAAAEVRAVLQVDIESEASAKTNVYSSCVAAKTRSSSRPQLMRCGGAWTGSASHPAATAASVAACACADGCCGTSSGRSFAFAGQRWPGDAAAQRFQPLAVVRVDPHRLGGEAGAGRRSVPGRRSR